MGAGLIRCIFLFLGAVTGNAVAGTTNTAGERQALQMLSSNMERHASVLHNTAKRTTDSVISSVQSFQNIQRKRFVLQMDINSLRSQLGNATDVSQRESLSQQILRLEKEQAGLLSVTGVK